MRPFRASIAAFTGLAASLLVAPAPAGADSSTALGDPFPGFHRLQGGPGSTLPAPAQITAVGVQSTGKIVIAQHGEITTLRRLHADGTPDHSWGEDGSIAIGPDWVTDLVVLPDDRVAVADRAVRQFTSGGWPDNTFSGDGVAPIANPVGYTVSYAQDLIREPDGDLVVAGDTHWETSDWDVFAMRFRPDGSIDPTYRGHRPSYCDADCTANDLTVGALADPGGNAYHLIGTSQAGAEPVTPISWKLGPDETLDAPPLPLAVPAGAVKTLIRGQSPASGFLSGYSGDGTYLAKLKASAAGVVLDTSWGTNGVQHLSHAQEVMAGAVQPDGKLVVATYQGLMRRNVDGSIDTTFRSSPSAPLGFSDAYAVAVTPDGGVLRAGTEESDGPVAPYTPFLDKYVGRLVRVSTTVDHAPAPGLTQTATVTYRNAGPDTAEGARVVLEATGGLVASLIQSQGSCTGNGGAWTCTLGSVPPGGQAAVQVSLASTTAASGTLTATGSTTTYDAHPADQVSSVAITTTMPATTPPVGTLRLVKRPAVQGKAVVGNKLRATTGRWSPAPNTYRYRWLRNGRAIPKASGRTYRVTPKDSGKRIAVRVKARKAGHRSAAAISRSVRIMARDRTATASRPAASRVAS